MAMQKIPVVALALFMLMAVTVCGFGLYVVCASNDYTGAVGITILLCGMVLYYLGLGLGLRTFEVWKRNRCSSY